MKRNGVCESAKIDFSFVEEEAAKCSTVSLLPLEQVEPTCGCAGMGYQTRLWPWTTPPIFCAPCMDSLILGLCLDQILFSHQFVFSPHLKPALKRTIAMP